MEYNNSDLKQKLLLNTNENNDNENNYNEINNNINTNNKLNNQLNEKNENYNLDIKIKIWNDNIEQLLKCWGEKCAGLSIMHQNDRRYWRNESNKFSIASILITTLSSSLSLSTTSSAYHEYIMYLVGIIGLISTLLQSFKQFYNADEKASEHRVISKQYSNFYRAVKLQLALKRDNRVPVAEFTNWAFKEYEKLLQESPPIKKITIEDFKNKFKEYTCHKPDICENDIIIDINSQD
tara:strand:- start:11386 stop:12096 length:711 start_codon:yes stop_codon:yes gene_type:complete